MTEAAVFPIPFRRRVFAGTVMLVGVAVSLLFLYSGIEKCSDIGRFQAIIVSHGLLEGATADTAAVALAAAEVGIGVLGLASIMMKGSMAVAPVLMIQAGLFLVFAVYAAMLVAEPPPKPTSCGCGVLSGATADWPSILTRSSVVAAGLGAASLLALRVWTRPTDA
jgi:methylamine utilization protein MauE